MGNGDTVNPSPQAGSQPMFSPPTQGVSNFIVTAAFVEFLVVCGQSRVSPPTGPDQQATFGVEWLTTLSVSPPAAKQLLKALASAIDQYEKLNGAIPDDAQLATRLKQAQEASTALHTTKA